MSKSQGSKSVVGWCAFVAVILAGFVGIIKACISWLHWDLGGLSAIWNTVQMISQILLLICVFFAGLAHINSAGYKHKLLWQVLFIVFIVLAVIGVVVTL